MATNLYSPMLGTLDAATDNLVNEAGSWFKLRGWEMEVQVSFDPSKDAKVLNMTLTQTEPMYQETANQLKQEAAEEAEAQEAESEFAVDDLISAMKLEVRKEIKAALLGTWDGFAASPGSILWMMREAAEAEAAEVWDPKPVQDPGLMVHTIGAPSQPLNKSLETLITEEMKKIGTKGNGSG